MYRDSVPGLEPCLSHEEIITTLDKVVQQKLVDDIDASETGHLTAKGEALQNAFMFFVTSVSRKQKVKISEEIVLRTITEQVLFHKKLLKLPKNELNELIP